MKKPITFDEIRQKLKLFTSGPVQVQSALVLSVNEEALSIVVDPSDDECELPDVRLKAGIDGETNGVYEIPEVNSEVLIGIIGNDNDTAFVVKCSKVAKVIVKMGDHTQVVTTGGVVFNEGNLGGLIKIEELKSELDKVNELLQALMTVLNGTPIPEPGSSAPSALQAALKLAIVGKSLPTYAGIEDNKITH